MYGERNRALVPVLQKLGVVGDGIVTIDFGSGAGHIARAIRAAAFPGSEVICVEGNRRAADSLRRDGLAVADDIADLAGNASDALVMIEVIEHLDDPVGTLRALVAKLRSGGRVYLTTPRGETRRGSHNTPAYDTPEHVQFFTERSLTNAFRRAGLTDPQFLLVNAMYPRLGAAGVVKSLVRPLWSRVFGTRALMAVAERA